MPGFRHPGPPTCARRNGGSAPGVGEPRAPLGAAVGPAAAAEEQGGGVAGYGVSRRTCHISATPPAIRLARWQGASGWRRNPRRMALAGLNSTKASSATALGETRHPTPAPVTKRSMCVRPVAGHGVAKH